jgi:hypothetical protein
MGFDALIRSAIATLHAETKSLQDATVIHYPWIGHGMYGNVLGSGILRNAIVEPNPKNVRPDVLVKASILILEPITAILVSGRSNPVDPRDEFQLPDGTRGPVVGLPGITDPTTHQPYFAEVLIGEQK